MWRRAAAASGACLSFIGLAAVYERPLADVEDGVWERARGTVVTGKAPSTCFSRAGTEGFCRADGSASVPPLPESASAVAIAVLAPPKWFCGGAIWLGRHLLAPVNVGVATIVLKWQNDFVRHRFNPLEDAVEDSTVEDEAYLALCEAVRSKSVGLLTLSNHASVFDDPLLLAALLPPALSANPANMRLSVCSQEICFRHFVVASLCGLGRTIPIKRGGGLDQSALSKLGSELHKGGWVHLFPEGHVYQSGRLGRDREGEVLTERPAATRAELGLLKWGAAKLIAHSSTPILVVPYVHSGLERVMPYAPGGGVKLPWSVGGKLSATVGSAIDFSDLISDHETKHVLLKFDSKSKLLPPSNFQDKALYRKITDRIETRLLELQNANNAADERRTLATKTIEPQLL
ncbi:hypothetical protein M885DRAFT_551422 [Pelagophyceae sp. CCMP2097]|nr:hypothetical protein M885DRAFT_551422 [Pelagophyceae sp. CCMP2097]